tara:strand:+ start:44 stop:1051 length:1008 start_codon:yes stop_codon:yes gene_type:complete
MNILISSIGRRTYLIDYFEESLAGSGNVYVCNSDKYSTGMLKTNNSFFIPESLNENYIELLLNASVEREISLLLPQHDIEAFIISRNRKYFLDNKIIPVVPNFNSTRICLDKYMTYQFLKKIGMPSLKTYLNIKSFLKDLKNELVSFPIIIKPRFGFASRHCFKIESLDELVKSYDFLDIIVQKEKLPFPLKSEKFKIIIQQYLEGKEYGADIINDFNGKYVGCFIKKKIAMRYGETEIAETIEMPLFQKYSKAISNNIYHIGNLDVDFILDSTGQVFILDLNPRFGGGYPFTHNAGVNLPKAMILWAENKPFSSNDFKMEVGLTLSKSYIISKH